MNLPGNNAYNFLGNNEHIPMRNVSPEVSQYILKLHIIISTQQNAINQLVKNQKTPFESPNKIPIPCFSQQSSQSSHHQNQTFNFMTTANTTTNNLINENQAIISQLKQEEPDTSKMMGDSSAPSQDETDSLDDRSKASSSISNQQVLRKPIRKYSKASITSKSDKKNPPQAKHLWINYGRKIIENALNHTEGETQNRIRSYIGKLCSKRDYEEVFGIRPDDSEEDKAFKMNFGEISIAFLKNKVIEAFDGSKYRDQMINQRHVVRAWIEKLIEE